MSEDAYNVVVCHRATKRLKRKQGPMPRVVAKQLALYIKAKTNLTIYAVQIRKDRTAYWKTYHRDRYRNDPSYRERLLKAANDHDRKARAAARGDVTPWLPDSQS